MEYKPKEKVRFDSIGAIRGMDNLAERIKTLVNADDRAAQIAWKSIAATSIYAANRLFEIADDIVQIDNAAKWGFGFEYGPFETWDAMGVKESVERMKAEGMKVPTFVDDMLSAGISSFYGVGANGETTYYDPQSKKMVPVKGESALRSFEVVKRNKSAIVKDDMATTLVDLGDGVLACEFHTKMNALDGEVIAQVNHALDLCESGKFDALGLANDGANFSVGANIFLLYMAAQGGEWKGIEKMVADFQNLAVRLRYSNVPTVAAPFNLTLGGGCEVSMWCNRMVAHAETYMGLVEMGVGLIPAGGGTVEMLARNLQGAVDDPNYIVEPLIRRGLETIAMAKVATSAQEAKDLKYMMQDDVICMNRQKLLESAKWTAWSMARSGFIPPMRPEFRLPGRSAYATFDMALSSMRDGHMISEHDHKIAMKVANVMTGGDCSPRNKVSEEELLGLEREAFVSLCGEKKTQERIAYMLENNKPLRN